MSKKKIDAKKTGRFSKAELAQIDKLSAIMTDEQIAKKMNRTVERIREVREKKLATKSVESTKDDEESLRLRRMLHGQYYWKTLQKQFTPEELDYFEMQWIDLVKQFKGDITATESGQILDYCRIEILKNRNGLEQGRVVRRCNDLERQIEVFEAANGKPPYEDKELNQDYQRMHEEITLLRSSSQQKTAELKNLLDKQDSLRNALRGSRDQRIERVVNESKTLHGWILSLLDDKKRAEEGRVLALVQVATERERDRLTDLHVYKDGEICPAVMNSSVMEKLDAEN